MEYTKEDINKVISKDMRTILGLVHDVHSYGICSMEQDIRNAIEDMIDDVSWFYVSYDEKLSSLNYLRSALSFLNEARSCAGDDMTQSLIARVRLMQDIVNAKQCFEEAEPLDSEIVKRRVDKQVARWTNYIKHI